MKRIRKSFIASICLLTAFVVWTVAICFVDARAIGPQGSSVGFAGVNGFVHTWTGVHLGLYHITDWLGLVPIFVCMGFGILGLVQWIKRKSIRKVDYDILVLGGFYTVTIAAYLFFESVAINYRPVLINGVLEASYPSSTTLLVMCVMPTAIMQLGSRIKNKVLRNIIAVTIIAFIAFMIIGRLLSGVHWLTDIVGGMLLGTGLVMLYRAIAELKVE
ncbi:MAG: phosphatase PAP2 family protein [Christensenellaceae bacterium]|nr:phosphatase PAP2 family protein [Christensenellaceae bacterium]